MSELIPAQFDYSELEANDRKFLKEKVGAIRLLARQCAESVIHIGKHLLEVRERLPYGYFTAWVESEFSWDRTYAYKLMQSAELFGSLSKISTSFDSSALFVLSAPSTPTQAREYAIDLAKDGEYISHKLAKNIVSELKANPNITAKEINQYFKDRIKEQEEDFSPADVFEDYKLLWTAMKKLIMNNYQVHFSWEPHNMDDRCDTVPEDPDTNLRNALFRVTVFNVNMSKPKVHASTTTLESLILDATDSHPMQKCSSCGEPKKLYEDFSAKKGNKFNRSRACKVCEVLRVGDYKKKKRRLKQEAEGRQS